MPITAIAELALADVACSSGLAPLASFSCWRGRSTAGPSPLRAYEGPKSRTAAVSCRRAILWGTGLAAPKLIQNNSGLPQGLSDLPAAGWTCGKPPGGAQASGREPMFDSRRREFIRLLGGAAAWPLAARAQQKPVFGFLNSGSADAYPDRITAFHEGLRQLGYIEGENLLVDYRWALGEYDRLPAFAAELVERRVSVLIATGGEPAALAAKSATSTIPIVFAIGGDPIKLGLVASYNRPGGNATGANILAAEMDGKRLELLHELMPNAARVGLLLNPNFPAYPIQLNELQQAATIMGI